MTIRQAKENIKLLTIPEINSFIQYCQEEIENNNIENQILRVRYIKKMKENRKFFEEELKLREKA